MITVEQLVFEYPTKRALHGVSFEVEPGSITALVGPNGAGKTTLMRCMAALETPYTGRVLIDGLDTTEEPRTIHQRLGYLQDLFGLYDALSVEQCLQYAAMAHHVPSGELQERVKLAAKQVGLHDRLQMKAGELSRGLRQRLAVGQVILHRPKFLLLDEPASGLDPEARSELAKLFVKLAKEGLTLMVSSHILAELEEYSTHMLIIRDGRIQDHQSLQALQQESVRMCVRCVVELPEFREIMESVGDLKDLELQGGHAIFRFTGDAQERYVLLKRLLDAGIPVFEFGESRQNLQDLYLERSQKSEEWSA